MSKKYFYDDVSEQVFSTTATITVKEKINGIEYHKAYNGNLIPINLIKEDIRDIWEIRQLMNKKGK